MKTIKFFISSTFKDLKDERDFVKRVLIPSIEELFLNPIQLSTVDLRWGITDDEIACGALLDRCIVAIDDCEPFFICILGDRYGSQIQENYMCNHPEILSRRKKLGYDLSATESEIAHAINKFKKGNLLFPYFIFIEDTKQESYVKFFNKLARIWKLKYCPNKLSDFEKLTLLKEDIYRQFKDRVYVYSRSSLKYKTGDIKKNIYDDIVKYTAQTSYKRYGNHSTQSSYFSWLLSLFTPSNPFHSDVKSKFIQNTRILLLENSCQLLESAVTKILSELPDDTTHVISYYPGPENYHNLIDNTTDNNSINSYRSVRFFWYIINNQIARLLNLNLNSPQFQDKAQVPIFRDLVSRFTKQFSKKSLIIYISRYETLKPTLKISDLESYAEGNNLRFILTSHTTSESDTIYKYTCPSLPNRTLFSFINEYLHSRFSKKLQHQGLIEQLISLPFIELNDIVFILNYLNQYSNHSNLLQHTSTFVSSKNINEFYSYLIEVLSNDIEEFKDFIFFTSISKCIKLEVITELLPSFRLDTFYGIKEVMSSYIICDASNTIMLTNDKLRQYLLNNLGNKYEDYSIRYYDCIKASSNHNDILECLFILTNINNREIILDYLEKNCEALSYLSSKFIKHLQNLFNQCKLSTSDLKGIVHPIDDYSDIYTYHNLSTVLSNLEDSKNSYILCKMGYEYCKTHKINIAYSVYTIHLIQCTCRQKLFGEPTIDAGDIINEFERISSEWTLPSDIKMKKECLEMAKTLKNVFSKTK